jgi:hypothetical protein
LGNINKLHTAELLYLGSNDIIDTMRHFADKEKTKTLAGAEALIKTIEKIN